MREDGGKCRAAYAPIQHKDENRGEHAVKPHGAEGGEHGLLRTVGGAQQGVEPEVEMRHHISQKNDAHKVVGIRQRGIACAEEAEDGLKEK